MAEISQIHKPIKIQLDLSDELRDAFNAAYLLNVRWNLNINSEANLSGNTTSQGGNVQNATPTQSNEILCDIDLPEGNNICIGAYQSRETSEVYYEIFNDEYNHSLWVYGTESQSCRKVYEGSCLGFHFEPQYHLPAHRCALFIIYDSDGSGNRTIKNKFYTFTDGIETQKFIDVESAIATDSYNPISFPYFQTFYPYCDPCEFIQLGCRPPQTCPIVLPFDDDTDLQFYEDTPENNNLVRKMWWFATSFGDVFGRKSVISPYSTPVYLDGGDCNINSDSLKCFRLQLDAGSAIVDKIYLYFSNDGTNFFQYDVIHKWEDCSSPPTSNFWDRTIALKNYFILSSQTCNYSFDFCEMAFPAAPATASITIGTVTYNSDSFSDFEPFALWMVSLGFLQTDITVCSPTKLGFIINSCLEVSALTFYTGEGDSFSDDPIIDSCEPVTDCSCQSGCFSTFTYTWDLSKSPPIDVPSASITIDGVTYTQNPLAGFHGLIMWLNSLNKGIFKTENGFISVSSEIIVYGDLVINISEPHPYPPDIEEVQQCSTANTFIYQFCGNKQCIPVAPTEVARLFDDLPIASVSQTMIDDKLSMSNNLLGYDNFICPIENITINPVQDSSLCSAGMIKIIVRAVIENFAENRNNPITQLADSTDIAFGGYGSSGTIDGTVISAYNQRIANPYKGFIGGLRGTPYKTVSKQYRIGDPDNVYGVPKDPSTGIISDAYNGNYFYQQWEFVVPQNTYYIFEIYSHLATDLSVCEGTSTYFYGTIKVSNYIPLGDIRSSLEGTSLRELLIPACTSDYTYPDYIVIADLSQSNANAVGGYLREGLTGLAVELADSEFSTGSTTIQTARTDANGFWFAMAKTGSFIVTISVTGGDCNVKTAVTCGTDGARFGQCDKIVPLSGAGLSDYNDCCHSLITGKVIDCDGLPVANIPVMITRTGRVSMTDSQGEFTILVHDDAFAVFNFETHRAGDIVIFGTKGSCIFTNGCDCTPCLPVHAIDFPFCFQCPVVSQYIGEFTLGNIIPEQTRGLKTGGTYAVSIIGYDYLDRNNSAQRIGFFTVPTIQSNGVFAPYYFDWAVTAPLNLESWVKKIRFAVTANTYEFLLSWLANKIEFVDSAGNVTAPEIAVNIKVYIDELTTFNTQNNFNTNTKYQWLDGDIIRWITNGDGTVYDTLSNGGLIDLPISSTIDGTVLLIPFDSRLLDLTANATFEIWRDPVCTTEAVYLEQCPSIPVLFNESTQSYEPIISSGTIPFYDTYWFYRSIPVVDKDGVPSVITPPHPFEHFAPSDFWGTAVSGSNVIRLFSTGRPFVRNENQRQTWYLNDVQYSDNLLHDGNINGLSTWRTENKKSYVVQGAGGIVATKAQTGLFFALCENNWFIANISQNLLLITSDGNVQANPDYLGNKQQKIGNIYGCDLRDTNTIIFHEEWITFADVKRSAWCKSNYQTVWDITEESDQSSGGIKSYWIEKFKKISELRDENQFADSFLFLHSAYDPKTNEILNTSFGRVGSSNEIEYGTDARDYSIENNETVSFNIGGFWSGSYSFTPEQMINFDSGKDGVQLISFKQGKPYIHHKIKTTGITFNNFFGVQYEPIIKFVFNGGEGKNLIQKRFLAMRILCKESLFYSDEVITQAFQLSQLPIEESQMTEQQSEVAFLCDIYTLNPQGISTLVDGDSLFGNWIKVRLLIDPNNIAKYFELSGINVSATESF